MDHKVDTSAEPVRRPLAGSRNLLMKTAGNTVPVTGPAPAGGWDGAGGRPGAWSG